MPEPADEQVRRLLADARVDEPTPADVVERLDRVLADLRAGAAPEESVVDLDQARQSRQRRQARRSRRVRGLLVAAVAVVAVGGGVTQLDRSPGLDSDATSDSAGSADGGAPQAQPPAAEPQRATSALTSAGFDDQVRRLVSRPSESAALSELDTRAPGAATASTCPDGGAGRGRRIAVRYEGRPGVLVVRPAASGTQRVDLFLCGETLPTRSVEVPAR